MSFDTEQRPICPDGCGMEIDPDVCHCGDSIIRGQAHDGHMPVPMGCACHLRPEPTVIADFPGKAVEEFRRRHHGKLPADVLAMAKENGRITIIAKERLMTPPEFWAYIASLSWQ